MRDAVQVLVFLAELGPRIRLRPFGQGSDGPSHEGKGPIGSVMGEAGDATFEAGFVYVTAVAVRADVDDAEEGDLAQGAGVAVGPELDTDDDHAG
jgi:hypothetical protein